MRLNQVLLAVVLAGTFLLPSCKSKQTSDKLEVNGTISNSGAKMIYLEEVPVATMRRVVVDSTKLGADGKFKLKAKTTEESIFNLRLDDYTYPLASVINDAKVITVDAKFSDKQSAFAENYDVKGSYASMQLKEFMKSLNNDLQRIYLTSKVADSLQQQSASDSLLAPLVAQHSSIAEKIKRTSLNAIAKSENPAFTMFVLGYYQTTANNPAFGLHGLTNDEVAAIINDVAAKYPAHKGVASVKREFDTQQQKTQQQQQQQAGVSAWVGKTAPEINLPDINGKEVSLSSYKGKYVLVDFWASWCQPCRYENPHVVSAYNKYKGKNFEIIGVSLDSKKDAWMKAIKDDKLAWTHISDLKGWESAVVPVYEISGIPYNVLLDPDGKVIAESLRGAALEAKLGEILK